MSRRKSRKPPRRSWMRGSKKYDDSSRGGRKPQQERNCRFLHFHFGIEESRGVNSPHKLLVSKGFFYRPTACLISPSSLFILRVSTQYVIYVSRKACSHQCLLRAIPAHKLGIDGRVFFVALPFGAWYTLCYQTMVVVPLPSYCSSLA